MRRNLPRRSGWMFVMVGMTYLAGAAARAGDDAVFTLVVAREHNTLNGRFVDQQIYVDDKYVGAVSNGYRMRFSVPTNATGRYALRVRCTGIYSGVTASFTAKGGDEVLVRTGLDYALFDGTAIRSVHVFPIASAKLKVIPPPGGITLRFKGREFRVESPQEIDTGEKTTENRSLRLEVETDRGNGPEKVVVFARPGKTTLLDFARREPQEDAAIVASVQMLTQLRACVFHHIAGDLNDLKASMGRMESDLRALHANGADQKLLDLRERYVAYFKELVELTDTSAIGSLAGSVLVSALGCAAEALVTQSVPSQSTVLLSSTGALLSTGYNQFQANSKLSELNGAFKSAEDAVTAHLRQELRARSSLRQNPLARELILAEDLLGSWSFDMPSSTGVGTIRDRYIFSPDGNVKEIRPGGDGSATGQGLYETDGSRVIVRWNSGSVETATVEQIDKDHFRYEIVGHSGDPSQVGYKLMFTRD